MQNELKPQILTLFKEGYDSNTFYKDLLAGAVVGILAFPMSLAFAIASGARPEQGIYTAIIAGFIAAFLGGSRVQVTGPTGAFVVIVFGILQQYHYEGLVVATLIAGIILLTLGFSRVGMVMKFIPYPVITGFTSGIALIIFTSQVKDFLGIALPKTSPDFLETWNAYFHHINSTNYWALGAGLAALGIVILWPKVSSKIPGSLVAIFAVTATVHFFQIPIETIGDRFGSVKATFPQFQLPHITWELVQTMIPAGIAVALLAGLESLLSATVADGMTGRRHRSDIELVAQGFANIGSALFGGLPATGAIARTATNIRNGGSTPIAALVHVVVITAILMLFGEKILLIPMCVLSAVLMVVAYNMSEWRHFMFLFKSPPGDISILLLTLFLTVLVDLTTAIEFGLIASAFLFLTRMAQESETTNFKEGLCPDDSEGRSNLEQLPIPPDVEIFQITGSFFFAAVEKFKVALTRIHRKPKVLILRMRLVVTIDATGIRALFDVWEQMQRNGTVLILSGVSPKIFQTLERAQLIEKIGRDHVCVNTLEALKKAQEYLTPIENCDDQTQSVCRELDSRA